MSKKKIGFIGYKGHARRLIKIFDQLNQCEISHFYHPQKDIDIEQIPMANKSGVITTINLTDLYSCDAIVIAAPNYTHFTYLKKLVENYRGYIFCEKPPVTHLKELKALIKFSKKDKERIYFNFNMRFSFLKEILNTFPEKYKLGEPIRVSILSGHGLAFRESYKSSWRSKKELHKVGVFETLGMHYFDLISFLFGRPNDYFYKAFNLSPYGDSIDTCHFSCIFENGCCLNLTCSYCIPFAEDIQINYTNGFIDFDSRKIKVFGPRETFDENDFFVQPPLIFETDIESNLLYLESLRKSCEYFIDCVYNKRKIDLKYFEQSILSNRIMFTAKMS